jgi:hypothetical protein
MPTPDFGTPSLGCALDNRGMLGLGEAHVALIGDLVTGCLTHHATVFGKVNVDAFDSVVRHDCSPTT